MTPGVVIRGADPDTRSTTLGNQLKKYPLGGRSMSEKGLERKCLRLEDENERLREELKAVVGSTGYDVLSELIHENKRLRAVAQEVWDSVPASYDPEDESVKRHAHALTTLGRVLEEEA